MYPECLCPYCCDRAVEAQRNAPRERAAFFRELVTLGSFSAVVKDALREILSRCGPRIDERQDEETERALASLALSFQEDLCGEGGEELVFAEIERTRRTIALGEPS